MVKIIDKILPKCNEVKNAIFIEGQAYMAVKVIRLINYEAINFIQSKYETLHWF